MIYLILVFSFLFESIFSNVVSLYSFLNPLFLLITLIFLYPYFKKNNFNFFIVSIICGLLYDLSFTNSPFINTICFGICSGLIILFYKYMHYNIINSNIINLLIIVLYRLLTLILLLILGIKNFSVNILLNSIYDSLIVNIIYGIIIFIIIDLISKIFNIKRVE